MNYSFSTSVLQFSIFLLLLSCHSQTTVPSPETISQINLKRGDIISCGPPDQQFGSVDFEMTCSENAKKDFTLAIELLHSFEYDESEKAFANVIDEVPDCAMAYWGVAMCNFHPLWTPPTTAELQKGSKALEIANSISNKSARESAYIAAIAAFYKNWDLVDHRTRCIDYEKAMEKVHATYPADKEAAIFYALALDASASPADKTYTNQKKAGALLNGLYSSAPDHPGIIHYLIHTYDYPGLAASALPFARKYASVAPSSAHALHMPSHIFTRLGLWDECIQSNMVSVAAAKCYAEQAGIKGHWDEELHGMDYLVYAYLQKGDNALAKKQLDYLATIREVYPVNFKVAYAFAAIPSRFYLENRDWQKAANLPLHPAGFPWADFPWQEAIVHFTRLMGAAHLGNLNAANTELATLKRLHDVLDRQKDTYKSQQVAIQIKTGEAWIRFASGHPTEALGLMKLAADMEDRTEKHPVTPGAVLPARELLGDLLLELQQHEDALRAYESVLQQCPNRFNSVYGAALAAERSGRRQKAFIYSRQLTTMVDATTATRPELQVARAILARQEH